jgi:uncharacterized membrane protein YfhO
MPVLKYYDGSDWEPVASALQGPTGPTGATGATGATGIVQIQSATYNTAANSTSSTDADTGLSVSITPTSASNKILIFVHQQGCRTTTNNNVLRLRLYRDATNLLTFAVSAAETNTNTTLEIGSNSCVYLDSPNTTSAVTYKTQFARRAGAGTVTVQYDGSASSITVMEVTP